VGGGVSVSPGGAVPTACRAKSGSGAEDGSDITGILHACKHNEKRSAGGSANADEVVEGSFAWLHQGRDALWVLGVGKTFKEAVGGAKRGKAYLRAVDQRRETFVMTLARFTKEHSLDGAAGTQRFFDEADALDADEAAFCGQATAETHAKLLEPAIVAAG
jgi:hypothetical protein